MLWTHLVNSIQTTFLTMPGTFILCINFQSILAKVYIYALSSEVVLSSGYDQIQMLDQGPTFKDKTTKLLKNKLCNIKDCNYIFCLMLFVTVSSN